MSTAMSMPQLGRAFTNPTGANSSMNNLTSTSQLLMNNSSSPSLSSGASLASGPASQPTSPAVPNAGMTAAGLLGSAGSAAASGPGVSAAALSGLSPACAAYSGSMLAGTYSRLAADSMYGNHYAAAVQSPYLPLTTDHSAFYSPLNAPYDLKDVQSATAGAYLTYDPGSAAMAAMYPYANGYGAADLASRRKAATRENTNTLKAWLYEHRKNPYPTKGEKIMLAIITRMTLTQVSTWFANARRRLKKDNKMTWTPRGNNDEDGDSDMDDDLGSEKKSGGDDYRGSRDSSPIRNTSLSPTPGRHDIDIMNETLSPVGSIATPPSRLKDVTHLSCARQGSPLGIHSNHINHPMTSSDIPHMKSNIGNYGAPGSSSEHASGLHRSTTNHESKPKIWSIANVVTSDVENKHGQSGSDHMGSNGLSSANMDYSSIMSRHHPLSGGSLLSGISSNWSTDSTVRSGYSLSNTSSNPCSYGPGTGVSSPGTGLTGLPNSDGGNSNLNKLDALASHPISQLPNSSPGSHATPPGHSMPPLGNQLSSSSSHGNSLSSMSATQTPAYGGFGAFGNYSSLSGSSLNGEKCNDLNSSLTNTAFRPVKR